MAENEVVFRHANERVISSITELKAVAAEDGQQAMVEDTGLDKIPLQFICECVKDTCRKRISLTLQEYQKYHRNKRQFVVFPGHNNPKIERVVKKTDTHMVVKKYITPPENVDTLHPIS